MRICHRSELYTLYLWGTISNAPVDELPKWTPLTVCSDVSAHGRVIDPERVALLHPCRVLQSTGVLHMHATRT
jgi:hypothetical protein